MARLHMEDAIGCLVYIYIYRYMCEDYGNIEPMHATILRWLRKYIQAVFIIADHHYSTHSTLTGSFQGLCYVRKRGYLPSYILNLPELCGLIAHGP